MNTGFNLGCLSALLFTLHRSCYLRNGMREKLVCPLYYRRYPGQADLNPLHEPIKAVYLEIYVDSCEMLHHVLKIFNAEICLMTLSRLKLARARQNTLLRYKSIIVTHITPRYIGLSKFRLPTG